MELWRTPRRAILRPGAGTSNGRYRLSGSMNVASVRFSIDSVGVRVSPRAEIVADTDADHTV